MAPFRSWEGVIVIQVSNHRPQIKSSSKDVYLIGCSRHLESCRCLAIAREKRFDHSCTFFTEMDALEGCSNCIKQGKLRSVPCKRIVYGEVVSIFDDLSDDMVVGSVAVVLSYLEPHLDLSIYEVVGRKDDKTKQGV